MTEAYKRACAVTQEHSLPALEAAHIRPFAKEGPHEVRNGLLLRADLHRLFEQGYLTVTPNYTLEVSDRLRDDYQNGQSYYPLRGTRISVPAAGDRTTDWRSPCVAQSERLSAIERVMELAIPAVSTKAASLRFWYGASIAEFVGASAEKIVGQLTLNSSFDIDRTQAAAWLTEIEFLQSKLSDLAGSIFFEFNIPRMGRRIDVVLVIGPVIFAIEFKVGEKTFDRSAIDQVWDYGLDLKNFHEASHDASIIPILIATEATECPPIELLADADKALPADRCRSCKLSQRS